MRRIPCQGKERKKERERKQSKQGNLSTIGFDSSNLINGFFTIYLCLSTEDVPCSMYIHDATGTS